MFCSYQNVGNVAYNIETMVSCFSHMSLCVCVCLCVVVCVVACCSPVYLPVSLPVVLPVSLFVSLLVCLHVSFCWFLCCVNLVTS